MRPDETRQAPHPSVGVPPPDPARPLPESTTDPMPVVGAEPEIVVEPEPVPEVGPEPAPGDAGAALFGAGDVERFRARWRELQADFVDDPGRAVQGADELVGEVMRALSEIVSEHKRALETGWRGGAGETEDLRVALRRYRSFFDQLLTS
ncbi:hypothetical protein [Actinophytocola gossypii]|uniref:WXG100 family type VII secretion target n=1 Tax=Actinophytocola gossypii TaxID=2812003 RepID=A0ABT2J6L5_9PSEU|nr:hypothetical protein [Actinophytocola gossypii]MCT2583428.1 hypothetical protein [Actinophytocola gossypii]